MEVLGLEHIDLTVSDLVRSTAFYAAVLTELGFSRFEHPARHVSWSNGKFSITLRRARPDAVGPVVDRYRVGLHHFALKVKAREDVDAFHRYLRERRLPVIDAPAEYPEYGEDYYAVFFEDPDSIKLEVAHFPWGYWKRVQVSGEDARPRYAR